MTFPIDTVRAEFPALSSTAGGAGPTFLDNPGGTQVPRRVADAVRDAMLEAASNLGGLFTASDRASEIWQSAHDEMASLFGAASPDEIIIGPSSTALVLHVSRSLGRTMAPGDEIIVTKMDHEGSISPWLLLAEDLGLTIKWLPFNRETWRIEPEDLAALLTDRTRLLALNVSSNLTGSINDFQALTTLAKDAGALVYLDAVQYAPHRLLDVQSIGADFVTCSSYKYFGPHLGTLWGRAGLLGDLTGYKCRCTPNEAPVKFEPGTPQTELLAGLAETIRYLAWLGEQVGSTGNQREKLTTAFKSFSEYEDALTLRLIDGISSLKGVTVHGITNPNRIAERVPTVSFTHESVTPEEIAGKLGRKGINVWHGHNYAYEPARYLGIDEETGVLRVGIAHYNTMDEIEATLTAIDEALS
ncbi:MAG: cysteine desulfurase-like protein [Rhodospirillaceae bacterium]|nr:cysteine desulfurase-like protein [Rhodospirillaceae bacterium]